MQARDEVAPVSLILICNHLMANFIIPFQYLITELMIKARGIKKLQGYIEKITRKELRIK